MDSFWFLLIIPVVWPFVAKYFLHSTINYFELFLNVLGGIVVVSIVFFAGRYTSMSDVEIWNGQVTGKTRDHGHYEESYDCNCTSYSCGTKSSPRTCQRCQTCYEDHYTVDWDVQTTIGTIDIEYLDRTSRSVYNEPDPALYVKAAKGQPASLEKEYTNYVQAVPQSLFHDDGVTAAEMFKDQIPEYPRVFDFYQIERVLTVGTTIPDEIYREISDGLDKMLITVGATKQANIIAILTNIPDSSYRYAVEQKWLGGNKNDIVIFVGIDDVLNIEWADAMTWALNSGNEMFNITMRDGLTDLKTLDPKTFLPFVNTTINELYDRPQMKDFEYLKDEADPPTWVIVTALILSLLVSVGLTYFFHRNEIEFPTRRNSRRYAYRKFR